MVFATYQRMRVKGTSWDGTSLLLYRLMLIACLFLCMFLLVGIILMMKVVPKVSVENLFNHVGKSHCCPIYVCYFKGFNEFLKCDFNVNGRLVSLCLALNIIKSISKEVM